MKAEATTVQSLGSSILSGIGSAVDAAGNWIWNIPSKLKNALDKDAEDREKLRNWYINGVPRD